MKELRNLEGGNHSDICNSELQLTLVVKIKENLNIKFKNGIFVILHLWGGHIQTKIEKGH